jgi:rod shape determining protein RodA
MTFISKRLFVIRHLLGRYFFPSQCLQIPPIFFVLLSSILLISLFLLYSAGRGLAPWCWRQFLHCALGSYALFIVASVPIRLWYSFSYGFFLFSAALLAFTSVCGIAGMGAQRWLHIAFLKFQPSELMRIALILALARYFHDHPVVYDRSPSRSWLRKMGKTFAIPCGLVVFPVVLTLGQPDLGTASLLAISACSVFFLREYRGLFS